MAEPRRDDGRAAVWVLTGPIGGGKSAAAAVLRELGAEVIDADAEGHAVLRDPAVVRELTAAFGPGVLRDGAVDRKALGRLAFASAAALAELDRITHPPLAAALAARLAAVPRGRLAVVEAAVYFRLPPFGPVDLVIAVVAPEALRRRRLVESGRLTPDDAARRIRAQRPLLKEWEGSDIVLRNDGDPAALRAAVAALHARHHQPEDGTRR